MKNFSLQILRLSLAAALVLNVGNALAQGAYPNKAITLVVPQPAGGVVDTLSRMWANYASKSLGQTIVVNNKPGATGVIGVQYFLQQPDDGYTVFAGGVSQMVLNQFTYKPLPYNPQKDVKGIALLVATPFLVAASPASGIKSYEDLVRVAKARPGQLNYGHAGTGGSGHVVMEMLQQQAGFKMTDVPYTGEAAGLTSLMGGQIDVMAPVLPTAVPVVQSGRIVPLVILGSERHADFPDVRTAAEVGLTGFSGIGWFALEVRAGVPAEAVNRLHAVSQEFLKDPEIVAKLKQMKVELLPGPADAVEKRIASDTVHWEKVLRDIKFAPR